jgi:hypothetical protein
MTRGAITEYDFTLIGCAGGGTNAKIVIMNGVQYIYKKGSSQEHIISEILAYKLYSAAGAPVPRIWEVYDAERPGRIIGMLIEFIEGGSLLQFGKALPRQILEQIEQTFLYHVLFANWDAKGRDNYIYNSAEKKVYIIDLGGALTFRAKGERKTNFGGIVHELETLPEKADRFFGRLKDTVIRHSITCSQPINSSAIIQAIQSNPQLFSGSKEQAAFAAIIQARITYIQDYCR